MEEWLKLFIPPAVSLAVALIFFKRWINSVDEKLKVIVGQELCKERRDEIRDDLKKFCEKNAKEHHDLWKHKHATPGGEVIVP